MSNNDKRFDRRSFMQLMGATALTTLEGNIAKALAIPANHRTGTINDVEHIVILMQENRPFDHHFGTLAGVRGFSDPRAVKIHLPLSDGSGTYQVPVFYQPAGGSNISAPAPPPPPGASSDGVNVLPPFRVDPSKLTPPQKNLGGTYLPGTGHSWSGIHNAWNQGHYDKWASQQGSTAMNYMTRDDVPYHSALADAFTVADSYFCSIMGPTNPNRDYMFTGCIGNLPSNILPNGTDGFGAKPVTYNGLSFPNGKYFVWTTYPERLLSAGVSWKIYQDLAGATFAPDFGDGTGNQFAGNYGDATVLYFNQYLNSQQANPPLFQNACTGTSILNTIPGSGASPQDWKAWQEHLFDDFRNDVQSGKLPQVSWIVAPQGYTEHSDGPMNYGAWYISQILDILVSNPDVFSKTVFIINYDEADGSFDHIVPPSPPYTSANGDSTVPFTDELITADPSGVNGPIGFAQRVPLLAISPWSKGGYVNSQVFDHTSVIRFIEQRFGVHEPNISKWRSAVAGDLTSLFDFKNPNNGNNVHLLNTDGFLPSVPELAGGSLPTFHPTQSTVIIGVPQQEKGVRPARALPYELDVHAAVNASNHTVVLTFSNTGSATVVFHVRSGNTTDPVRYYTVEPGKLLTGSWSVGSSYDLSVYGPNGFVRYYKGSIGGSAAVLSVASGYDHKNRGSIEWKITNVAASRVEVSVLDAYTGDSDQRFLEHNETFDGELSLQKFYGWYDLIITVAGDPNFEYRLAGHVETGDDSISDPALGGLVTLKG